jgi:4-hydroxy-3-methylbut-2-en-1-yl diphosphate reductase
LRIFLANPRGFCAAVERAIGIVERALEMYGAPVYVRQAIVHNKHVVDRLSGRGAMFVEDLSHVPEDSIVIFSAHGVAKAVREDAARRNIKVFDATCPLVTKVHMEVGYHQMKGANAFLSARPATRRSKAHWANTGVRMVPGGCI